MGSLVTIKFVVVDVICFVQHFKIMLFDNVSNVGSTLVTQLQSV